MIYVDLDDTLSDMTPYALEYLGVRDYDPTIWALNKHILWPERRIWNHLGMDFWSTMPKSVDFERLVGMLPTFTVLTALPPFNYHDCINGKLEWMDKHLNDVKIIFSNAKERYADPKSILIDDSEINIQRFNESLGLGFLVPRPWNKGISIFDKLQLHLAPLERAENIQLH